VSRESLVLVATYRRTVRAPLERIWENVLDWEHLPWLHRTTFADIKALEHGIWGWRARIALQPAEAKQEILLEVLLDRPDRCYVARTVEGPGKGTEIWTGLSPIDERRTAIVVSFHVPGIDPSQADAVGAAYTRTYTRLWDEDEAMMVRREAFLSGRRRSGARAPEPLDLGPLDGVRDRLPLLVELGGRPFRVLELDGQLVAHATTCPHMLGPLDDTTLEDGCVRCPWHGYRFDVRSGQSSDGRGFRLAPAPTVRIDPKTNRVALVAREKTTID
jgi:nitrite reductase/ring-hydroxylating ferredoxin subunit